MTFIILLRQLCQLGLINLAEMVTSARWGPPRALGTPSAEVWSRTGMEEIKIDIMNTPHPMEMGRFHPPLQLPPHIIEEYIEHSHKRQLGCLPLQMETSVTLAARVTQPLVAGAPLGAHITTSTPRSARIRNHRTVTCAERHPCPLRRPTRPQGKQENMTCI